MTSKGTEPQSDSEHQHEWRNTGYVVLTYPPLYTFRCQCGAVTHNPETARLCNIAHSFGPGQ